MGSLSPFEDLARFQAVKTAQRLALGASLAKALGPAFREVDALVGEAGMVAVDHVASRIRMVAIPGGAFQMGLTKEDVAEARRCLDFGTGRVEERLRRIGAAASPAHRVTVPPFLLAVRHLKPAEVVKLTSGCVDTEIPDAARALLFHESAGVLRLPTEAELEFAGREGGAAHFLSNAGANRKARRWPRLEVSAWGLAFMTRAAWTADAWHDTYDGAPKKAAPWSAGAPPGVYRGCLNEPPATDEDALFALAACRGRLVPPDDEWVVGLRPACSLKT